ncbi:MAG: hypothetical protein CME36_16405 [unclassified Hahellaceae]|nr:hypothetical protein [Hahellaceae bacterium]
MSVPLQSDTVDVWRWDLSDSAWDQCATLLSRDEADKAARFRCEHLQAQYRRGRGVVRLILAQYLGRDPASLMLICDAFGKPAVADSPLHFNLSHSSREAILAIARQPVGIDIEYTERADIDVVSLLDLVCHAREKQVLLALDEVDCRLAFYRLWTQKEAYCKALGHGLQKTLSEILILQQPTGRFHIVDSGEAGERQLEIRSLPAPPGYLASLCVSVDVAQVRTYTPTADSEAVLQAADA